MVAAVKGTKSRLPDGRVIRALRGAFKQADMFGLKGRIPNRERIMNVRDLDDALVVSGAWKAIDTRGWWRTNRYGVYARGFEKELDKPVGASVVWIEKKVSYTFEVPDVNHPHDRNKGLREATGMLDFALDKLQYDADKRIVSVTSDFNPESDVIVRDIMRPNGWALVDADCYPLRTKPSNADTSEARYSSVRHSDKFEGEATGWHGSISRHANEYFDYVQRGVFAFCLWRDPGGVAVVGRDVNVAGKNAPIL